MTVGNENFCISAGYHLKIRRYGAVVAVARNVVYLKRGVFGTHKVKLTLTVAQMNENIARILGAFKYLFQCICVAVGVGHCNYSHRIPPCA